MAASEAATDRGYTAADSTKCRQVSVPQSREIIKPTVMELTKEVRTNILCTVEGCGKILPNTPALNMHLVKSHRIKVNGILSRRRQVPCGFWTTIGASNVDFGVVGVSTPCHTAGRHTRVTTNSSQLIFFLSLPSQHVEQTALNESSGSTSVALTLIGK